MHTYLFGRHTGEVPTHLVGTEMDGHQVFAVAELDGPDHSVFIGLKRPEAPTGLEPGQQRPMSGELPGAGEVVADAVVIVQCVRDDCLALLPEIPVNPCYLPGWEVIVFVIVYAEHLRDALPRARQHISDGAVAVATDGGGRFLVELAANDRSALQRALEELASIEGIDMRTPHWADGRAVARA